MNSVLIERVDRIVDFQINNVANVKKFIKRIDEELYLFRSPSEKEKFLLMVYEKTNSEKSKHEKMCPNPETCNKSLMLKESEYFVSQLLEENNFIEFESRDFFSEEEKVDLNSKLDTILKEIEFLKKGQGLIYDDLVEEFEELKEFYFIGKKNWKQNFIGKLSEMVFSGMISETFSKKIIDIIKEQIPGLILLNN